ncbi:MAG: transposase [Fibrobacteres bacterium]|nr:transposase [Fibrobacterota bacterium]
MRYSRHFKERAVSTLLGSEPADPVVVAKSVGVQPETLERWKHELSLPPVQKATPTGINRLDAIVATSSMTEEQRNAWCRSNGIFPSDLAQWRATASQSLEQQTGTDSIGRMQRARIHELEREVRRKDRALAETAALLVLSKKLDAIFHKDADE